MDNKNRLLSAFLAASESSTSEGASAGANTKPSPFLMTTMGSQQYLSSNPNNAGLAMNNVPQYLVKPHQISHQSNPNQSDIIRAALSNSNGLSSSNCLLGSLTGSTTTTLVPPPTAPTTNQGGRLSTLDVLRACEKRVREKQQSLMLQRVALLRVKQQEEQRMLEQKQLEEIRRTLNPSTAETPSQLTYQPSQFTGLFASLPNETTVRLPLCLPAAMPTDQQANSVGPLITNENKGSSNLLQSLGTKLPASCTKESSQAHEQSVLRTTTDTIDEYKVLQHDKKRPGRPRAFPQKLFEMLTDMDQDDYNAKIVSFLPHGRAFMVYDPIAFEKNIMPKYFHMARYSSFQRQLNHYDIRRVIEGCDKNAYFHEYLIRGQPELCDKIERQKF